MATQTLRISTTPTSARTLLKTSTPKSILKRPTPLPLSPSPFPFSANFAVFTSPSAKSPHVHFPPSPCLISTYTAHSPNTYDRAPISVSPNPLALPAWGDRVYSPTLGGFKLADPPKHTSLTALRYESPTMAEFEDPRSPRPKVRNREGGVRFAELPNQPAREPTELSKALTSYPRSPYPSAPLSPVDFESAAEGFALREKATSRRTLSLDEKKLKRKGRVQSKPSTPFTPIPSPLRMPYLSPVVEQTGGNRKRSKKPPPLPLESSGDASDNNIPIDVSSIDSSTSSIDGNTSIARLNQAFWQSMSLAGIESTDLQGFRVERSMTSCKDSPCATDNLGAQQQQQLSSSSSSAFPDADNDVVRFRPAAEHTQPQFLFATRDGVLWSPGLPRKSRPETTSLTRADEGEGEGEASALDVLLSPGKKTSFGLGNSLGVGQGLGMKISRSIVASPSPNDPTATFPSFSTVLDNASDGGAIPGLAALKYPPRAQVVERRARKGSRF